MELTLFQSNAAESFAQANGLVQALLGWLLWRQAAVRKTWGLGWLALSMACGAVVNVATPVLVTPTLAQGLSNTTTVFLHVVLGFASMAALVTGMLAYCEHYNRRLGQLFTTAWVLLPVVTLGGWLLGFQRVGDVVAMGVFSYLAYISWVTARRFPGTGHRQLALAMLSYPLILVLLGLMALEPQHIRYLSSLPSP